MSAASTEFEEHRQHLLGVGYRLTGSWADAEDAVQEAWLRLQRADRATIQDLRAWLTTVVGRIGLDRLRSATARRETYVGSWLPEPVVQQLDTPADEVVRADDLRMAALVVMEKLSPDQRVAMVLHDAFDVPFGEIAQLLGCSSAAARQHASRARRTVAAADPPPRIALDEQRRVLEAVSAAMMAADLDALVRLPHPDVAVVGDGGGAERTARRPVRGAGKAARFLLGLLQKYGHERMGRATPVLVNGDLGLLLPASDGDPDHPDRLSRRVTLLVIRDGVVVALYDVVNPAKLTTLPPG